MFLCMHHHSLNSQQPSVEFTTAQFMCYHSLLLLSVTAIAYCYCICSLLLLLLFTLQFQFSMLGLYMVKLETPCFGWLQGPRVHFGSFMAFLCVCIVFAVSALMLLLVLLLSVGGGEVAVGLWWLGGGDYYYHCYC